MLIVKQVNRRENQKFYKDVVSKRCDRHFILETTIRT